MDEYAVMFPADDEAAWAAGGEAEHQAVHDVDAEFARRLADAGGAITGGAGLGASSEAVTLRAAADEGGDGAATTPGPARPGVAQLSGFFLVRCDDRDALVAAARVLTTAHPVVEIRPLEG